MKRKFTTVIIGALVLAGVYSCEGYLDQLYLDKGISTDVEISPSIAAPVAYGSFNIADMLTLLDSTGFVGEDDDGLLYIYYSDTAYSVNIADLLTIPDVSAVETYIDSDITFPPGPTGIGQVFTFTKTERIDFTFAEGDRLDSLFLSAGSITLDLFSEFEHSGDLTISSSDVVDPNGDTLVLDFTITELDGSYTETRNIDLDGYALKLTQNADSAFVEIFFELALLKSANGITAGQEAGITMNFDDLEFEKLFGEIVQREVIDVNEEITIDIYENDAFNVVLDFFNPQFNLYVENSFGVPVYLDVTGTKITSSQDDLDYDFTFQPGVMPFRVQAPTIDQLGETVTSVLSINSETSNVSEMIAKAPKAIDFRVVAGVGGAVGATASQNFILDSSDMLVRLDLELPIWFRTPGYSLEDTLEVGLGEILGDFGFIDSASLTLTTTNQWPLELAVQAYFLDGTFTELDSLFEEGQKAVIEAADVDEISGEVDTTQLVPYDFVVSLNREKLEKIETTEHIRFKFTASTTDGGTPYVKILSDYLLDYKLSLNAALEVNPAELNFE